MCSDIVRNTNTIVILITQPTIFLNSCVNSQMYLLCMYVYIIQLQYKLKRKTSQDCKRQFSKYNSILLTQHFLYQLHTSRTAIRLLPQCVLSSKVRSVLLKHQLISAFYITHLFFPKF